MKKQNIFIDFDGTICFDTFWRTAPETLKRKIEDLLFHGGNGETLENWMRGKLTSEEICKFVALSLEVDFKDVFSIFVADCKSMTVSADSLRAIDRCRKNNNVYLITDNMDSFTIYTEPQLKLGQHFDRIYNSADLGILKGDEDESLFIKALKDTKSDIKKSILLDNSKSNCEIFKKIGGNSFCVRNENDVLNLLQMLEN